MKKLDKAFSAIYRYAAGDCTNGGQSAKYDYMYVIESEDAEKYISEHTAKENDKVLVLERRVLWGEDHWFLRPLIEPKGKIGPMMGGNYAEVKEIDDKGNFRVTKSYFLPIHDRYETQEEYDALSI